MRLALLQTNPQVDIHQALKRLERASHQAKVDGADVLVTPEMFLGGYNVGAEKCVELASYADDALDAVKRICKHHEIAVVVGLALPGTGRPFNAVVAIGADGDEKMRYHKTHLFGDVDRSQFSAGNALSGVFDLQGWSVGLAICYDIEFPEVSRNLALKGAELIIVPTANMIPYESVATRLVPARAEENAICVAYSNYVGAEGQFHYNGHSCVCGPDGNDLGRADGKSEKMLFGDCDLDMVKARQLDQTYLIDRRAELYTAGLPETSTDE